MKRILVSVASMRSSLGALNVKGNEALSIIGMFEVVKTGSGDALSIPDAANINNQLSGEYVLKATLAFWICVLNNTAENSLQEQQALGAIRGIYFMAIGMECTLLCRCIEVWWEKTSGIHGSAALGLWA